MGACIASHLTCMDVEQEVQGSYIPKRFKGDVMETGIQLLEQGTPRIRKEMPVSPVNMRKFCLVISSEYAGVFVQCEQRTPRICGRIDGRVFPHMDGGKACLYYST